MTPSRLLVIFYGGPGSGKTTQADILAKRIGGVHVAMGAELRKLTQSNSERGREIRTKMLKGQLVPLSYSLEIIADKIRRHKDEPIILDGFPRNITQAKSLNKFIKEHKFAVRFILLDVSTKTVVKRLLLRGKTQNREDDKDIRIIEKRIKLFDRNSKGLLNYYDKKNELVAIKSDSTVRNTAAQVYKAIK